MKEHELTSKSHWQNRGRAIPNKANLYRVPLIRALRRFIPEGEDGRLTCLEVGCVPGRYLLYFNKILGYRVEGVDFSDEISSVEETLSNHHVENYRLYQEDFFTFSPKHKYDLVSSFGFVEHFNDTQAVIDMHIKHIKKGGYLLITVPNVRFVQKWFISRNNPEMLKACNLGLMEPTILQGMVEDKLDIIFSGYVGTMRLYGRTSKTAYRWKIVSYVLKKATSFMERGLSILNIDLPNKYISPHIAIVAKRVG